MNRDKIIRMAREAGAAAGSPAPGTPEIIFTQCLDVERFFHMAYAAGAAAERNKLAQWMIKHSYATGHGDTMEDLLKELEWQIRESEREACAKVCDARVIGDHNREDKEAKRCAEAIRARGQV